MKKNRKNQGHIVDFFFTLSLFCLFAASALIVVIIGSGVYRNTTVQMEENYVARTALSYVAEKVRQHDTSGGVRLTEEEGETVLVLQNTENTTDTDYLTYIYAYDGWLCELVIRDDAPFSKAQGERILEIDTFRLVNEGNGFLRITVSDSGSSSASCLLHLRSSQEHREKP